VSGTPPRQLDEPTNEQTTMTTTTTTTMMMTTRRRPIRILVWLMTALVSVVAVAQPAAAHRSHTPTGWWLDIPSIQINSEIALGGQPAIDTGHATLFDGWGATVAPGGVGTFWVAGHRTTKGSVFRRLPRLATGELVHVWTDQFVYSYRITSRVVTPRNLVDAALVYGTDPDARRILLQCSWTKGRVILYAGELEAVNAVGV
jgi:sortase (surface protein transpeptidase)